jgi:hypothetical protein
VASEVERAVRTAAEEALEGLRAAELRRGALLQAQADELERALEALERTAEGCGAACAASEPPLAFLQRFRALSDTCERLTLKPLREDIEARRARALRGATGTAIDRLLLSRSPPRSSSRRRAPPWHHRRSATRRCCRSC